MSLVNDPSKCHKKVHKEGLGLSYTGEQGVKTAAEFVSGSDFAISCDFFCFFSLAFSRPALQNCSNLELRSSSDLLDDPAVDSVAGFSSKFSSSTSCNTRNKVSHFIYFYFKMLILVFKIREILKMPNS